jgi:hypothetical protein
MMIIGTRRIVNLLQKLVEFGCTSERQGDCQIECVRAVNALEWRQLFRGVWYMTVQCLSLGGFRQRGEQEKENDDPVRTHLSQLLENSCPFYHTHREVASSSIFSSQFSNRLQQRVLGTIEIGDCFEIIEPGAG